MIMVRKKVLPLSNSVKSRGSGLNEGEGVFCVLVPEL